MAWIWPWSKKPRTGEGLQTTDDLSTASELDAAAQSFSQQGKHRKAAAAAQQSLDIKLAQFGPVPHPEVALAYRRCGRIWLAAGVQRNALPYLTISVLQIAELPGAIDIPALQGLDWLDDVCSVIETMATNLGKDRGKQSGDLLRFLELYFDVASRWLNANHHFFQQFYVVTDVLFADSDLFVKVSDFLDLRSLTIADADIEQFIAVHAETIDLEAQGRYREGAEAADRLVAIGEAFGCWTRNYAIGLDRQCSLQRAVGDHARAITIANELLWICGHLRGDNTDLELAAYWQMAEAEMAIGRLGLAQDHFEAALQLCEAQPHGSADDARQSILAGLGNLYRQTGQTYLATTALEKALELSNRMFGMRSLQSGQIVTDMANISSAAGNLEVAAKKMREGLAIIGDAQGEDHPAYARSLHDLSVILNRQGDNTAARVLEEQATDILEAALGSDHPIVANHLISLANFDLNDEQFAAAEAKLGRAVAIKEAGLSNGSVELAGARALLAHTLIKLGQFDQALALAFKQLDSLLEWIGELFAVTADDNRTALVLANRPLDFLVSLVAAQFAGNAKVVEACFDRVLRAKGITAEALGARRDVVLAANNPDLAEAISELARLRDDIGRGIMSGPGPEGRVEYDVRIALAVAEKEKRERALARMIPEEALSQRLKKADTASIAKVLPAGSVFIDFIHYGPSIRTPGWANQPTRMAAFVLRADGEQGVRFVDLGDAAAINALVADFIANVGRPAAIRGIGKVGDQSTIAHDGDAGKALRAMLLDPLLIAIGECSRWFISPDGELNRLPFEILPLDEERRLIDVCSVSYVGAGRDILRFGTKRLAAPSPPLLFADPDYDLTGDAALGAAAEHAHGGFEGLRATGMRFARLAATRSEGEIVAAMIGGTCLLEGDAIEGRLKACRSPQVLHIATHGYFIPDRVDDATLNTPDERIGGKQDGVMQRCGLALAGANTWMAGGTLPEGAEDALFTGEDATGLDLLATDLVVLSACETGLGDLKTGEGVFGLRRAFILAGAKALVISLWKVPDAETQELMLSFYRLILDGNPPPEALRAAQLAIKARNPDPFYWGAFVCVGDPAPLQLASLPAPSA